MKKEKIVPTRNYLFEHIHEGMLCLSCGKVMISYHRHDYKTCGCPNETMIDGGQIDYVRYGGADLSLCRRVMVTPVLYTKKGQRSKKKFKTYRETFSKK